MEWRERVREREREKERENKRQRQRREPMSIPHLKCKSFLVAKQRLYLNVLFLWTGEAIGHGRCMRDQAESR